MSNFKTTMVWRIRLTTNPKKYFPVLCRLCYWQGCSSKLDGCYPIADTGDYTEAQCPSCGDVLISEDIPDIFNPWHGLIRLIKWPGVLIRRWNNHRAEKKWIAQIEKEYEDYVRKQNEGVSGESK